MFHAHTRKMVATLSIILAIAMFFSGCSLFKKQIEIPAGHFFEEGVDIPPQESALGEATVPEEPTAEATIMYVKVTADVLNIRSGPGSKNELVGQLYAGDVVAVLEETDNWLRICEGWIYRSYTEQYHADPSNSTQPEA